MKTVLAIVLALAVASWAFTGEEGASAAYGWKVDADYPVAGIPEIDTELREWLGENIRRNVTDYAGVVIEPDFPEDNWWMGVGYEVSRPSDRAVSYIFTTILSPEKAAHPMTLVDVLSFDAASGKRLAFGDVFARPEAALEIMSRHAQKLAKEKLIKEHPDTAEYLTDDMWYKEGFEPKQENYAALVLEPGGVRVVFQRYQVLAYVFGNPEAFFPLELFDVAGPNLTYWEK